MKSLKNLLKKGLVTLSRKTAYDGQTSYMEAVSKYEVVTPYGFYSKAPSGALVLLLNLNGNESNKVGIEFDNKTLIDVESGEVVIYHPVKQSFVKFKADGSIEIEAKSNLNITATTTHTGDVDIVGDLDITGNLTVGGSIVATGSVTGASLVTAGALTAASASIGGKDFSSHTHSAGTYVDSVAGPVSGASGGVV